MTQAGLVGEAAVMAAVCGGALLALWWIKRQPSRTPPGAFPTRPPEGAVRAMADLLAELKRTSDSMASSLDRRAADLRALIAEADQRLARIEEVRRTSPPAPRPESVPGDTATELKPVFEQVYALADAGKPLLEIARETQLNKGSVQLILGLREMRKGAEGGGPGPARPPLG